MDELKLQTIAELETFIRDSAKCMNEDEKADFVDFIAVNPEAGKVIQGTGGVRKVRWATGNKGKSGGVRVIYYFHDARMPLYLITAYAKSGKGSLDKGEKNAMKQLTKALVDAYESRGDK